jgi:hypothetical protein
MLQSEAGGAAFLSGKSSGAVLALEAANRLTGIKKLALYKAPFIVDDAVPQPRTIGTGSATLVSLEPHQSCEPRKNVD